MIPRANSPRARLALVLLVCAPLLASCGRLAPTAPRAPTRPSLAARIVPSSTANDYLDEVVAMLAPGVDPYELAWDYDATCLGDAEYGVMRMLPQAGETCEQLVQRMSGDARVITSERNAMIQTAESRQESVASDDAYGTMNTFKEQPAAASIQIDIAHRLSRGAGVTIAILDTGVDPNHPALRGRFVPGKDYIAGDNDASEIRAGVDTDHDGRADEAFGHGTHVAGIAALAAPGARIMPVRVLDSDGRGTVATVAAGIRWAMWHGARVLNLSLGMLHDSETIQHLLQDAEEYGVVVVCSAGNWGSENPREYPAASGRALAVGASDAEAQPAPFTSFGSHLAVCAPGVGVRSAYPGGGWAIWSGTSMSTPFVSGTVALLLELHPGWTTNDVAARIGSTARSMKSVPPEQIGKLGDGMLDAGAALAPDAPLVLGQDPSVIPGDDPTLPIRR